jgi:hypothetical protein
MRNEQQRAHRLVRLRLLRLQQLFGQGNHLLPIVSVLQLVERICQSKALFRQQIRLQERPQAQLRVIWHHFRPGIRAMVRQQELGVLVARLEGALDQADGMELEHLHFLLSMAFTEAGQQLLVVKARLRLVVCNADEG